MHRTTVRSRRRLRRILPAAVTPQSEEAEGCAVFIYLFIYLFNYLFLLPQIYVVMGNGAQDNCRV